MKLPDSLVRAAILVVVVIAAFLLTLTASAALSASPPSQSTSTEPPPLGDKYLIALPVTPLDTTEAPENLTPDQAHHLAARSDLPSGAADPGRSSNGCGPRVTNRRFHGATGSTRDCRASELIRRIGSACRSERGCRGGAVQGGRATGLRG